MEEEEEGLGDGGVIKGKGGVTGRGELGSGDGDGNPLTE
jgi:hypothetical protein